MKDTVKRYYYRNQIIDTEDEEFNAILFIELALKDLDPEVKWRVLEFASARIRNSTYGSENVAKG